MEWQDAALIAAGIIGSGVAVVHCLLTQRLMVRPIAAAVGPDRRMPRSVKRLLPILLHFSTVAWFLGGLVLIAAAWFSPPVKLAAGLFIGSLYLFGAVGNLWGTRGRHSGWLLYAVALGLIGFGITGR